MSPVNVRPLKMSPLMTTVWFRAAELERFFQVKSRFDASEKA